MINYLALRYRGEDSELTLPEEPVFPRKKEEAEEEPGFSPLAQLYENSRAGKKGRSASKASGNGGREAGEADDKATDAQAAALRRARENGETAAGQTSSRAGTASGAEGPVEPTGGMEVSAESSGGAGFWAVLLDGVEPTILAALVRGGHGSGAALWSGGGRWAAHEEGARRGHTAETLTAGRRDYAAHGLAVSYGADRTAYSLRGSEARRQTADLDRFTQREARRYDGGFVIY